MLKLFDIQHVILNGVTFISPFIVANSFGVVPVVKQQKPNIIVILTDDQGYADLSCQGSKVIKTPNIDRLAATGIRFTDGYVTAPQCMPSRAGLLTGKYQQTFGLYDNNSGPLPFTEKTIGNRMQEAGYRTGSFGKWHMQVGVKKADNKAGFIHFNGGPEYQPRVRGFDEYFSRALVKQSEQFYYASHDLDGNKLANPDSILKTNLFRVDAQTKAALGFLKRNKEVPFFLYLAYFAPHVPLVSPEKYLNRFPDIENPNRKLCAAMLSSIDDGVGEISSFLKENGLEENTLVFFISDNGAPKDLSDGSINDPLRGYKGELFEGGIRVPFIMKWKGTLPENKIYYKPVITLDVAATALALAGEKIPAELPGKNLIPYLLNEQSSQPHEYLFWKWMGQSAIRSGKWKYFRENQQTEYLFDLEKDITEKENLISIYPGQAESLRNELKNWEKTTVPPQQPR